MSGIAAAGAPAMTALIASFSAVASARKGGRMAIVSSGKRWPATMYSCTRVSVGGISGRPSPQPCEFANSVNATTSVSTSCRRLLSQSVSHPEGPQERSVMITGDCMNLFLLQNIEWIGQDLNAQARSTAALGERPRQILEVRGRNSNGRNAAVGCGERVVNRPGSARAAVREPHHCDVDIVEERFHFLRHPCALLAG